MPGLCPGKATPLIALDGESPAMHQRRLEVFVLRGDSEVIEALRQLLTPEAAPHLVALSHWVRSLDSCLLARQVPVIPTFGAPPRKVTFEQIARESVMTYDDLAYS